MNQNIIPFETLRKVALFQPLDDQQIQHLRSRFHWGHFVRNDVLFYEDDPGDCLYVIAEGRVRIFLDSHIGREIALRVYGPGDSFGEFAILDGQRRSTGAMAMDNVVVYTLDRESFWELLQKQFDLTRHVITMLTERLRYTTRYTQTLAFLPAPQRIASMLLLLCNVDDPAHSRHEVHLTQNELASLTNMRREWLNQQLQKLVDMKFIAIDHTNITVLDQAGLRQFSEKDATQRKPRKAKL